MNEERAAVAVHQLSAGYGKRTVLRDVAFSLPAGERIALIGPNGAGKSTLLKTMLGFLKPKSGTVEIFGEPLKKVRSRIAYMPQSAEVNWNFPITVEGVAEMGLFFSLGWFRKPGKAERERVEQALEELGLTDLRKRQISELSGGQKKRVFWRALWCRMRICFFSMSRSPAWITGASAPSWKNWRRLSARGRA